MSKTELLEEEIFRKSLEELPLKELRKRANDTEQLFIKQMSIINEVMRYKK